MKKIRIKLALFFISLMFISSILSFFISSFFPNSSIKKEMMLNQQVIAISILELGQKTDLSIADIIKMTSTFMYEVRKV